MAMGDARARAPRERCQWNRRGGNPPWPADARTFVMAAVSVVLPWSTWPIVPTFHVGLVSLEPLLCHYSYTLRNVEPHKQTRTADLVLTKNALYLLSYVGPGFFNLMCVVWELTQVVDGVGFEPT